MFENKENYGALFKNDQKSKDNQPDYTGKVNVEGADYKIGMDQRKQGW